MLDCWASQLVERQLASGRCGLRKDDKEPNEQDQPKETDEKDKEADRSMQSGVQDATRLKLDIVRLVSHGNCLLDEIRWLYPATVLNSKTLG